MGRFKCGQAGPLLLSKEDAKAIAEAGKASKRGYLTVPEQWEWLEHKRLNAWKRSAEGWNDADSR